MIIVLIMICGCSVCVVFFVLVRFVYLQSCTGRLGGFVALGGITLTCTCCRLTINACLKALIDTLPASRWFRQPHVVYGFVNSIIYTYSSSPVCYTGNSVTTNFAMLCLQLCSSKWPNTTHFLSLAATLHVPCAPPSS